MGLRLKYLCIGLLLGVVILAAGQVWLRPSPPRPLTPAETKQLDDGGFTPVPEGPIADATPGLPGTPAGTVTVTMPRRRGVTPGDRPPALARHPAAGQPALGPGGPVSGAGSPLVAPVPPAPILPRASSSSHTLRVGLESPRSAAECRDRLDIPTPIPRAREDNGSPDDLSCSTTADFRAAGGKLFTTGHVHACLWEGDSDQVCRDADGSEADITSRFDRAALCGRPVRGRLLTLGLGVTIPAPEIVAGLAYYGAGKRFGYYGALRYSLDPAARNRVTGSAETGYSTVADTAGRLRVEAGMTFRFGG